MPALRRQLLTLAPLIVVRTSCTVAGAVLLARALTRLMGGETSLSRTLLLLGVVLAVRAGCDGLIDLVGERARHRVRAQLRRAALTGLLGAGASEDPARAAHALGPGMDVLDGYTTRVLPALVGAVVTPPVVLVAIGLVDRLSVLLLLLVLPLVPLFLALVGLTTRDKTQKAYATLGVLAARLLDLLQGLPTLKIHGRAEGQVAAVGRVTERFRAQTVVALRWAFLSGLVLDLIATLSVALVAVNIGLRLNGGSVPLAAALTVLLLAPEVFTPLRAVGAQFHASTDALEAARTALAHAAAPVAEQRGTLLDAEPVASLVAVTVRHPGRPLAALAELSLTLVPGEVVALEGASGAGKSTLLGVLLGAVVPVEGTVVTAEAGAAWRARVAWTPQRPRPSRATAGDQVLLGDPGASWEQISAALRECDAPPAGTLLGEGGRAISAGQRRRVALAQALLRARAVAARGQVPLVLLDEPSEDLDEAGEQVVAEVVDGLRGIAAVVMVTHSERLAEVADRRVRLADGRLVVDLRQVALLPRERRAPRAGTVVQVLPDLRLPQTADLLKTADLVETADLMQTDVAAALVRPGPPQPAPVPVEGLARTFAEDGRGLAGRAVLALGLSAAAAAATVALAACSAWLVLRAAQQPGVQALGLAVVGVRTFALAKALLRYAERLVGHDLALRLLTRTRVRVVAALVPLAPTGLGLWRRGDVLRRFSADVDAVQDALVRGLLPIAGAGSSAGVALLLTWFVAPAALPALGLTLAVCVVVLLLAATAGRRGAPRAAALAGRCDEAVVGWVEALPELWAYGAAVPGLAEIDRHEVAAAQAARPAGRASVVATTAAAAATALAPVLVLAAAAGSASGLAVGVVVLVAAAAVEPVAGLSPAWAALGTTAERARRVGALLATPAPVPEPACPVAPPVAGAGVSFTDVDLGYGAPVVTGLRLDVRTGTRVALVGPSGCGKSTVLLAALRLLAPTAGSVTLTGGAAAVPISDVRSRDLSPVVSGCLQDDHVFAASLRENLRIGWTGATDTDLDAVAERVGLLDWVRTVPDGWSTPAGPDGDRLSGGQRQRLLLARALLADPQVLVLDEPTAHLDTETEQRVMADLLRVTRGRTLLLSTHRRTGLSELDAVVTISSPVPAQDSNRGSEIVGEARGLTSVKPDTARSPV